MESQDILTFTQKDLPTESFSVLRDLKRRKQLCDVTITVKDRSFLAHRIVLAATIPYFRIMFTSDRIESKARKLDLKIVEADALESLIDFVYCSRLKITSENARSLLFASAFLKMEKVKEACSTFLEKRLNPYNVMEIRSLADSLTCKKLVENCDCYVRRTFDEFSLSSALISLKFQYIKELTSRDDLQVTREEKVYEAIMKWVKSSSPKRDLLLPELLRNVRLSQISPRYLAEHVATEILINKSVPCCEIIEEAKNYHSSPYWKSSVLNTRPRLYKRQTDDKTTGDCNSGIYCVCYSNNLGCIIRNYDHDKMKWTTVMANEQSKNVTNVVAVNAQIFVFAAESLKTLNLKTMQWATHAPCPSLCPGNSVMTHTEKVYCFGASEAKTVWSFNKVTNEWCIEGRMLQTRSRAGIVSLGDYIYLLGGLQDETDYFSAQDTVERYNPQTKASLILSPMLNKRWGHGVAAADNNKIYACGGYRDNTYLLSKAEVYDCSTDQWTAIQSMAYPRYPFYLVSHNEKLYAVGGKAPRGRSLTVEIYDPGTNQWTFGDPVPSEDESLEVKGVVIISNVKTASESSARKPDKPRSDHVPIFRRNSRQSFSKR